MLKVNYLSDYWKFKKFMGINGAMIAARTQAKAMRNYVNVLFNNFGKKYDLIHSHGSLPYSYWIVKRGIKVKIPIIMSVHQTHHDTDISFLFSKQIIYLIKLFLRRYYELGDILICPTENLKRLVINDYKIRKPIKVISNGVDTKQFKKSKEKRNNFRQRYGLNKPTIICVGMPIKRKGFYDFINISNKLIDFQFLWVGKRGFPIVQQNHKINRNNLLMPGYIKDIIEAYSGSDIFCFPSYYEGEGIAILEAMSCGLPVIIRDLPVYKGRFFDGMNCLKARDNIEFIEKINYLINNPNESKKIAQNGLKTVQQFDINEIARKIYEIYLKFNSK